MHTIITHFNNSFNALHRGVLKKWSPVAIYNNSPQGGCRGCQRPPRLQGEQWPPPAHGHMASDPGL